MGINKTKAEMRAKAPELADEIIKVVVGEFEKEIETLKLTFWKGGDNFEINSKTTESFHCGLCEALKIINKYKV